ncbi:MAG: CHAP domain-containing protein [Clostridia bacterium]|nr:CHAP domain-containing protein [Clostridia bacterium]
MKRSLKAALAAMLALIMALATLPALAVESAVEVETDCAEIHEHTVSQAVDEPANNTRAFVPRLSMTPQTAPKYYTTWNVFYNSGYGMPNCTCYAFGRAYEILETVPNLSHGNAGEWWGFNQRNGYYPYGQTPALGAIACWSKPGAAGHVAVVEQINGDEVITSESAWRGTYFYTTRRSASHSNFSQSSAYQFQGFIYVYEQPGQPITPPAMPSVSTDASQYCVGSTVTISWNAVSNNQFYWINVYKDGALIIDQSMDNNTSLSVPNIDVGDYWVYLSANNSAGTSGASSCYFSVVGSAPEAPIVTTDSTFYSVGSTVTVSWNAVENNQFYWTNVYRNGEMIYDSSLGNNTSFELTNVQAGAYWINLSANNSAGGNGSSCEFVVVDSAPEAPNVTTNYYFYAVGSTVTVSWNAVENNQFYWTNVYRNGEMIYDSSLGNNTSFELTNVQAGAYWINLSANNPAGGNGSSCEFVVVDAAPEAPVVTTDSTSYAVGSTVTVSWNAVENNQFYWTNVYRNGEMIYDSSMENDTSFTLTNVQAGNYVVLLSANNPMGGNGSSCSFIVNAITPGDIDSNGTVTMLDALLALRMGMGMLPVANLEVADMNGDGAVTVIDALMIMRLTMGTA